MNVYHLQLFLNPQLTKEDPLNKLTINLSPVSFGFDSNLFMKNRCFLLDEKNIPYLEHSLKTGTAIIIMEKNFFNLLNSYNLDWINHYNPEIIVIEDYEKLYDATKFILKNQWIIGVTGSAGKTTTTRNLSQKFTQTHNVNTNFRNYNTPQGLMMSVLSTPFYNPINANNEQHPQHIGDNKSYDHWNKPNIHMYELGISQPGDMDKLIKVVSPNIVIILPINFSHSANFMDLNQLLAEKFKIINGATKLVVTLEKYKHLIPKNVHFISLESLTPGEWQWNQWNNDEIYDQWIHNLYICLMDYMDQRL
jgi:UDP-N-acetylmuramyl pentapeptide synthase